MTFVVLVACLLGRIGGDPAATRAAVSFLAAELALSYLAAGAYKAASPYWQSGSAFAMLVHTRMYGQPTAARVVARHPAIGHMAALSVVFWESLFVVALTAPPPAAIAVLVAGAGFHLGCGFIMGLNRFVWAFVASYPALLCTNTAIRAAITPHVADMVTVGVAAPSLAVLVVACGGRPAIARLRRSPRLTTSH
jgi:hypothetical protein